MTLDLSITDVIFGLLIVIRLSGIFFALPFFGESSVPVQVRILLSFALGVCLYPVLKVDAQEIVLSGMAPLLLLIFKELLIGVGLGLIARLMFDGLVMSASIVGYQMGFGTANILLPGADMQMNSFTAFHRLLVVLVFFGLNFHLLYIDAAHQSFEILPIGHFSIGPDWIEHLIKGTAQIFLVAVKMSAPVLVALLFAMAAMGLIARTVPQMNVFTMSFPLSFFIGLITYAATFPLFPGWLRNHYLSEAEQLLNSLALMR